ncbi:MAG: hypothetical protein AB8G22_00125 [Saprospiraceae bacterium]
MFTFGMVVILTALMLSLVMAQPPQQKYHGNEKKSIFRRDPASNRLLIHPKSVGERLLRLTLRQNQKIVLSDDLSQISADAVYGLDLSQLNKGKYIVELITAKKENIQEEILVD